MAYLNASTWNVAAARRASGLGDDAISTLSIAPDYDTSNLLQYDPALSVSPSSSSLVGSLTSLASSLTTALTAPSSTATINVPAATAAPTSGISNTALEYIGIAAGAVLLLALISGRRRR